MATQKLRYSNWAGPRVESGRMASGASWMNVTSATSLPAKFVFKCGRFDLLRNDCTVSEMQTYMSAIGTTGGTSGFMNARIYAGGPAGETPAVGASPLVVVAGADDLGTGVARTLIWTFSNTKVPRFVWAGFVHDVTTTPPQTVTLQNTTGARNIEQTAVGANIGASVTMLTGRQWTEASFLTTNTWGAGSVTDTTSPPAIWFRFV